MPGKRQPHRKGKIGRQIVQAFRFAPLASFLATGAAMPTTTLAASSCRTRDMPWRVCERTTPCA